MRKILFLPIILSLLMLSASCGGGSDSPDNQNSSLDVNLSLYNRTGQEATTFTQDENIEFVLSVTNTSNTPVTLNFNSGQQYDFHILYSSNAEVWRWSEDYSFAAVLTELNIDSQETVSVNVLWNQTVSGDSNIEPGSYTAIGSFLDQSPEASFEFTIQ